MSRTIGVFFGRETAESPIIVTANDTISPKQNVFSEVHTIYIFKSLQETRYCLTLDVKTRYVAVSAVTNTHTHSLIHKTTTITLAHAPRVNCRYNFTSTKPTMLHKKYTLGYMYSRPSLIQTHWVLDSSQINEISRYVKVRLYSTSYDS